MSEPGPSNPANIQDITADDDQLNPAVEEEGEVGDEAVAEDGDEVDEGGAAGEGSSSAKSKKKKKKSKGKKVLDKISSALPGGEKQIPTAVLDRVMEETAKTEEGQQYSREEVEKQLKAMKLMSMLDKHSTGIELSGKNKKDLGEHKFWKTQPVPQFVSKDNVPQPDGPIDPPKSTADVRQEPYPLPNNFVWSTVDVQDPNQLKEVYDLLTHNYVEDLDATMRFDYSASFLSWALKPPGYVHDWHIGVRVGTTGKLVAFISGIPVKLRVKENSFNSVEINFLCVHKKLRSKRLAPVLIKEVTRRCNLVDVWQAIYTAGVVLPTPVAVSRYYHRNLNPAKLLAIKFALLPRGQSLSRAIKHFSVPPRALTPGWREMTPSDVPQVGSLLRRYLARFDLAPVYSDDAEIEHWFLSGRGSGSPNSGGKGRREGQVTWCFVVEDPEEKGKVTDFMSFYSLPSSVLNSKEYPTLDCAYSFYYATEAAFAPTGEASTSLVDKREEKKRLEERLQALMGDLLTEAKNAEFDVLNSLTGLDNNSFLNHHKFGPGDGYLNYYLYNYRTSPISGGHPDDRSGSSGVGVVML